jgi:N-formylglutamate deformylase
MPSQEISPPTWRLTEGPGPLVAVAIHDGHDLRPEVEQLISLSEQARLREEDPFTGKWTAVAQTRLIACRSRFEVDLNRPRERAVYVRPEDAWGLHVWRSEPPAALVAQSLAQYDAFYAEARRVLSEVARREGRFVLLDLHSYNHRRGGPGGAFDSQTKHPDVNIGTGTMHRARWAPVIDRVIAELRACDDLGRQLDVRENIKFLGGAFSRWVHETFPETGCSIAIELKKFFMDEWSGQLYTDLHHGILRLLRRVAAAIEEELRALPAAQAQSAAQRVDYGHFMVGIWRCPLCGLEALPRQLMEQRAEPPFRCRDCGGELAYTE